MSDERPIDLRALAVDEPEIVQASIRRFRRRVLVLAVWGLLFAAAGLATRVINLGLPDRFLEHGNHQEQLSQCGLDAAGIRRTILRYAPTGLPAKLETA